MVHERTKRGRRVSERLRDGLLFGATAMALVLTAAAGPAHAQSMEQKLDKALEKIDVLENTVKDLRKELDAQKEEIKKPAAVPPGIAHSGKKEIELTVSGQVNRAYMYGDDGESGEHFFVDNDASSTRINLQGKGRLNEDVTAGAVIEVQIETNTSAAVNLQPGGDDTGNVGFTQRKLEIYLDSMKFGRVWLGHGDTASNGTAEQDLSGTAVSTLYSDQSVLGGGINFFDENLNVPGSGLAPPGIRARGTTIGGAFTNLDGFSRRDRVRYDTPKFFGFNGSVSAAEGDRLDGAVFYAGQVGPFKAVGAVGLAHQDHGSNILDGSISVLHDSGLNITFAGGTQDLFAQGRMDPSYFYVKPGYQFKVFDLGTTAVAFDFYRGWDIAANDDESTSFGIGLVQNIDAIATELFLAGRVYDLDRTGTDFNKVYAIIAGGRVKF